MGGRKKSNESNRDALNKIFKDYNLSPQQIAVITALLMNTLQVQSVLVDKEQTVEVLLVGSLRRKSRMDKLLDEISGMPVGDLWESLRKR